MSQLLALDLATSVGFAVLDDHGLAQSGRFVIDGKGAPIGRFLHRYAEWLTKYIGFCLPRRIVFEAPWIGPNTHQDTARKLMCLAGRTEEVAYDMRIPIVREVNNAEVRKHFVGKGRGARDEMKRLVQQRCIDLGWKPESDDEADALSVMDFAAHVWRLEVAYPRTALEAAI